MARMQFDIIDCCNLHCPSCYHGIHGGTKDKMTLETLRRVVDHCMQNLQVNRIYPYNWSEPLLHKELPEFVRFLSTVQGVPVTLSSNLSHKIPAHLKTAILRYVNEFKFSVSGITQTVYEKYHRGGNSALVLQNIFEFLELRDELKSRTTLVWVFGRNLYNTYQEDAIKLFCDANNIVLSPIRYYITDIQDVASVFSGKEIHSNIYTLLYHDLEELRADIHQNLTPGYCPLLSDIVIDCKGYLMTCCATKITLHPHITEIKSLEQLIDVRLENDFCKHCFASGFIGYFRIPRGPRA